MNLKELKSMIAEEYSNYLEQEEVAVDVQPDVDVDADMDMGELLHLTKFLFPLLVSSTCFLYLFKYFNLHSLDDFYFR